MFKINKELEDYLMNPLVLLTITDKNIIDKINNLLPYSTGFEIECNKKSDYKDEYFNNIPDILDVNTDSSEQRYRIPNGIKGLICLYNICNQLKKYSLLNSGSGIHYHLDTTDCFEKLQQVALDNKEWILEELDTWDLNGCSFKRIIQSRNKGGGYLIFNDLRTFEFRIGEMSFNYEVLLKRILHANDIIKRLKYQIGFTIIEFENLNKQKILDYLKLVKYNNPKIDKLLALNNEINNLKSNKKQEKEEDKENIQEIINNRVIRL